MVKYILAIFIFSSAVAFAADTVPSEASIREILAVTDAKQVVDATLIHIDGLTQKAMQEATKGHSLTSEQQQLIEKNRAQIQSIMKEELAWDKLEPLYIQVYQKSLTQEEVNGMLAFYKTPVGQSVIKKLPLVVQNSMVEMQKRMAPMMQRIQRMQQDVVTQLRASDNAQK
jgi:hypothetical protein